MLGWYFLKGPENAIFVGGLTIYTFSSGVLKRFRGWETYKMMGFLPETFTVEIIKML